VTTVGIEGRGGDSREKRTAWKVQKSRPDKPKHKGRTIGAVLCRERECKGGKRCCYISTTTKEEKGREPCQASARGYKSQVPMRMTVRRGKNRASSMTTTKRCKLRALRRETGQNEVTFHKKGSYRGDNKKEMGKPVPRAVVTLVDFS